MAKIFGKYLGDLRVENIHEPSKNILITDAPTDIQGRGDAFAPTDLVGTAFASCILTTMGIVAKRDSIDLRNSTYEVEKEMTNSPRRISSLAIKICMPSFLTQEQRTKLEKISMACPVHQSLHPSIKITVSYEYNIV